MPVFKHMCYNILRLGSSIPPRALLLFRLSKMALKQKIMTAVEHTNGSADYDSMIENGTSDESNDDISDEEEDEKTNTVSEKAPKKRKSGVDTSTVSKVGPSSKKQKKSEKVKPPTLEEINELKETRNLFHSNLFRLQVKEMLEELKIKEKYTKYLNNWLEQFKHFVRDLESQDEKENVSEEMTWIKNSSIKIPLVLKRLSLNKQKQYQFQFIKPTTEPYFIGAVPLKTLVGAKLVADVCIPMPAACFQKENYLNLVYDQKRAMYLTYIADQLLRSKHFEGLTMDHLKFNFNANNPLKPVLEISPHNAGNSLTSRLRIRLFVTPEQSSFKLSRFVPWNSNIRSQLITNDDEDALPLATPHYNAGVLFDLTMEKNQQLLRGTFDEHKNFQEGLILLKVWLQQRQLHLGFSGFPTHILSMYIAYLFKAHKLHVKMSSYQVARTVWNNLAHSTWDEAGKGITLCSAVGVAGNQPTLEQFHTFYDVVFVDVTGFHNICANLSLEIYKRVRVEARTAVDMLNDMKLNSFQLLFMTKYPMYAQLDHVLKIHKKDAVEQILDIHVPLANKNDYVGHVYPQLLTVITRLLRKGLNERVQALLPLEQPLEGWSPQVAPPITETEHLYLGITLSSEHALDVLDKGPESIDEKAEEFRKFWGEKAQLRRFQDGTITESVVWAAHTDPLRKKRLIVRSIILHLLQHHLQLEASDLEYIAGEFDVAFQLTSAFKVDKLNEYTKQSISQDTDAEMLSLQVIRCFDDLARKLHTLVDLPLEIVSIAGISPVFRYCEPEPILPQARMIKDHMHTPNVQCGVIQLGLSGKWPSELAALRALKAAFYIKIAELLQTKHKFRSIITYDGILVLKQGYCFSLEIAHPKELALLKKEKNERGITQYVDSPESINLEKRHYILPKMTSALHSLYQEHNSFGGAVMIAKRWLYTQLIDEELWPDECTELLIASQYLRASSQHICCSPQTGFVRYLHLLANTDWRTELIVVNFNNSIDESNLTELEKRFNEDRDAYPPLCIATAYDDKYNGLLWTTKEKPSVQVLARVTLLARQTLAIIETSFYAKDETFIKPSKLLKASKEGYDMIVQLKPDLVSNSLAYEFGSPFSMLSSPNWRLPLAGTNFVRDAIMKLREAYSDFAAFFYNPRGGKEIAIVWRPAEVFNKKPFKVTEVNGYSITADSKGIQCKKETLIEDFKFILKDFYLRVDTPDAIFTASKDGNNRYSCGRYFAKGASKRIGKQDDVKASLEKSKIGKKFKFVNFSKKSSSFTKI